VHTLTFGGCVSGVEANSLGTRLDVRPGDVVLSVNAQPLRDVIDFRYYCAEPRVELVVRRRREMLTLTAERDFGEPVGIEFAHPTFDVDVRRCTNRCEFCFVTQMPRGMRRALYCKDDDYRYSFLFGQFVTLTNLSDDDWQRIAEQHLSPLYVSVHATDPALRRRLLGKAVAPDVLPQLRWLIERDIRVHAQLVLIPERNDGAYLARSLDDLTGLYPGVQSVSIVPVGLTRHHAPGLRSYRQDEARLLLDQVEYWRAQCRRQFGLTLVYPSDEWYLLADRPIPLATEYDGFGQLENGVGIVRRFLDDWAAVKAGVAGTNRHRQGMWRGHARPPRSPCVADSPDTEGLRRPALLVCGELAGSVLDQVCSEMNALLGTRVSVRRVVNRWYGGGVTVSGLLTGRDVIEQLGAELKPGDLLLLPRVMFDAGGRATLDDMAPEELQAALGTRVVVAQSPEEIMAAARTGHSEE
jgi:putative radical SAM enzyme (TIGR03279 family)